MTPAGIDPQDWAEASARAKADRERLAFLVAEGVVLPVRGTRRLTLPPTRTVNLAIRPRRKRR